MQLNGCGRGSRACTRTCCLMMVWLVVVVAMLIPVFTAATATAMIPVRVSHYGLFHGMRW